MRKSLLASLAALSLILTSIFLISSASTATAKSGKTGSKVAVAVSKKKQVQRKKSQIRLTAKVAPRDDSKARGYVRFKAGGKTLAKAAVHDGVARAKLPRRTEPGRYKIRAMYVPKNTKSYKVGRSSKSGKYVRVVAHPKDRKWDRVAKCESDGKWRTNTGNGYYGGLQFSKETWKSVGGDSVPSKNSRVEQIKRGKILKKRAGAGQWPVCGKHL